MARTPTATPDMTPEEALQTIASVRGYRERLTARAAGLVWMVWGLALSFHAFAALFVEFPGFGADVVEGDGVMPGGWVLELIDIGVTIACAGILTNAIWRAHALETERTHAPWIPFAAGAGVILLMIALTLLSNQASTTVGHQLGPLGIAFAPLALLAAAGAVAIAVLQRRRVPMWPGMLGALVLLNLFVFGRFISYPQDVDTQSWGAAMMALSSIVVYFAVGTWTMRRA
ncbi:MAG TPA: hypothetical protein VM327_10185 [Candidatus Thermoplasmatota archaeon]|nr:hypothetical protein [Candidatus Thermoplasmatota archaeon]